MATPGPALRLGLTAVTAAPRQRYRTAAEDPAIRAAPPDVAGEAGASRGLPPAVVVALRDMRDIAGMPGIG
jgi:hypothetical protein